MVNILKIQYGIKRLIFLFLLRRVTKSIGEVNYVYFYFLNRTVIKNVTSKR